jgi:hypothetical protein
VVPKPLLIGGALLCAAMIGVASQHEPGDGMDFFRVESAPALANKPVAPVPASQQPVVDRMMTPPPESPAQQWVTAGEKQVAARKITAPKGDNAYDSALLAYGADPGHEGLQPLVASVVTALSDEMATRLRKGDADKAREYLGKATLLADRTAPLGNDALRDMHQKAADALKRRVASAEKNKDREDAIAAAALANEFAGDQVLADALRARADKIADTRQDAADLVASAAPAAPTVRPLTVAEYARFAAATGRESALCREKLSILRLMKPRDWKEPGFAQSDSQPVVCISYQDAVAYAHWASRNGQHVRLPTSAELGAAPASTGGRSTATWLRDGSIAGTGWRGPRVHTGEQSRGYDDVGVRFVHE